MKLNKFTQTAAVTALSAVLLAGVTATSAEAQRGRIHGAYAGGPGHFGAWRGGGWRGGGWAGHRGWGYNRGWGRGWDNGWGWGAAGLLGGLALGALANNSWGTPGWGGYYGAAGWDTPVYGGPYYRQCICR